MDETSLIGKTIADTFFIENKIGEGGMGTVFIARHVRLGKRCAIKVLNPEVAQSYPAAVERFEREAKAAGQLGHVGICQVQDVNTTDDGMSYMVMDLLEGEDLETRMVETGLLQWEAVCRIISQTCDALATAHESGIVHRDLKPANIFLSQRKGEGERAVILDFGVAKMLDAQRALTADDDPLAVPGPTPTLTKPGTIVGTPNYMSPEQASGIAVDHRADIYSMGAVLFHMGCGEPPFNAESLLAVLTMIAIDPVPSISDINPNANRPKGVDDVIRRAMAKDPADRFSDVRELANALPLPDGAVGLGLPIAVNRSGVTAEHGAVATPIPDRPQQSGNISHTQQRTAAARPDPRSTGKDTLRISSGPKASGEAAPAPSTPSPPISLVRSKPKRLSWAIIAILLAVGIVGGAIAALGPLLTGNSTTTTPDEPQPTEPSKADIFDRGLADVGKAMGSERWTAAAGLIGNLKRQFPERENVLGQMSSQIEMEMEAAVLHRSAKAQVKTSADESLRLCAQIHRNSVYWRRAPCDELIDQQASAKTVDAGPDARPNQGSAVGPRPKTGPKTGPRPTNDSEIEREIDTIYRRNRGLARRCFDNAFSGGFRPMGTIRVSVRASIGATGSVTSAQLLDPRYRSKAGLKVCLENLVRSWQFPGSSKSRTREFQFTYKGQEINLDDLQ